MTNTNPAYILKLVEASEALSAEKKDEIKSQLGRLSVTQLGQIQNALEDEQRFNADHYRKVGHIKTLAAEKKIKLVYHYAEAKLELEEEQDIAVLEDQLAHLDA